jgi:hypothetical protein
VSGPNQLRHIQENPFGIKRIPVKTTYTDLIPTMDLLAGPAGAIFVHEYGVSIESYL